MGEALLPLLDLFRERAAQASATQPPKKPSDDASAGAYSCPQCKDEGIIFVAEQNVAHPCPCMEQKKLQRVMKSTNISTDAIYKTFESFNLKGADPRVVKAHTLAKEYSDGLIARVKSGQGLVNVPWFGLVGTAGSGKTHLATAIVEPLLGLGINPLFFNWVQSFTEWMAYYNADEAHKVEEIRQRIYNCELLIIDDVCKESQKDTWVREFYGIVDYRYRKRLPIIYTSEYYSELIGYLSKATTGRLLERTISSKGKKFFATMLTEDGEDPLALDYRLKNWEL
ncbi:ATP-binding protein [Paenibacillus sp. NPDC057967]|uniref:ATP-binding protein n=1 Tax=Paenibacillus sp. NPDC057967 TaxID=3346293 RepID=UPI0036DA6CE1